MLARLTITILSLSLFAMLWGKLKLVASPPRTAYAAASTIYPYRMA